jgi:4-coumarate--CoA ligase
MSEIHADLSIPRDAIPDDLTLPQFMLDHTHTYRDTRPDDSPWLIESVSGRKFQFEEVGDLYGL